MQRDNMQKPEDEKLEHILNTICGYIERAFLAAQELGDEYFDRFDSEDEEDKQGILYGFKRCRILNDIVWDYLNRTQDYIELALLSSKESQA